MAEEQHSLLSPSGAARWMRCPGSLLAESCIPSKTSTHANEGTAAHHLAALTLNSNHKQCDAFLGRVFHVTLDGWVSDDKVEGCESFEVTQDMVDYVQEYVDTILQYAGDKTLLVEQRVNYSDYTGVESSYGTADAIILGENELQVHDLKYGRGVHVDAKDNPQLMIYALGALATYDHFDEVERVTLGIHMPRKSGTNDWSYNRQELEEFAAKLRPAAQRAYKLYQLKESAEFDLAKALSKEGVLQPSTKACQWCDFKAQCPALGNLIMDTVTIGVCKTDSYSTKRLSEEIEVSTNFINDEAHNATLSKYMELTDLVDLWVKAVRERATDELKAGNEVEGFKLVRGRKGPRKWEDKDKAEETMKSMRLKLAEMYKQTIISPTDASKLLEKAAPRRWARLQPLITQSDGSLSIAPDSDPRKAVVVETAEDDEFQPVTGEDSEDLV